MLAQINANLVAIGSHKPSKKPKAYPRPGTKNNGDKYGSKAVPVDEMRKAGTTTASALKDLVVQMVTLSIVKSPGVTSEAAGGVSVTYNSAWTNGSFDAILANNAGMLAPYRLEGVF